LLKALNGNVSLLVCSYEGAILKNTYTLGNSAVLADNAKWSYDVQTKPVKNRSDSLDMHLTFKLLEGTMTSAGYVLL
jgi:hypothetical protein